MRVLDVSIWRPGPYATSLLTALGADVVKVEPPGGDPMRHYDGLFGPINAGKHSLVLDLKDRGDRERALELAADADVLVEGFRPGVMARLGLGYPAVRKLNPGIVYCSITGYGQEDPRASVPGHDVNYQAWAGALAPEGGPARMPPLPTADLASGLSAAFGICAALLGRRSTGAGVHLDVSMTDVMATWTGSAPPEASRAAEDRTAGLAPTVPGYGLFATAEGKQVALGVVNEPDFWEGLCGVLGLEALGGLAFDERTRRGPELQHAVAGAVAIRGRDELVAALTAVDVPVSPVLDRAEMVATTPFPPFPIRLPLPPSGRVPEPDEHRGRGFSG